jgi:hypothetical protein
VSNAAAQAPLLEESSKLGIVLAPLTMGGALATLAIFEGP